MAHGKIITVFEQGDLARTLRRVADPEYHIIGLRENALHADSAMAVADVVVIDLPGNVTPAFIKVLQSEHRPGVILSSNELWSRGLNGKLQRQGLTWVYNRYNDTLKPEDILEAVAHVAAHHDDTAGLVPIRRVLGLNDRPLKNSA